MASQIEISRFYAYPIEKVWKAISTQEALAQWLMPNDFKLEEGHTFTFRTKPQPGFDGIVYCRLVHFKIPDTLQFTWQGGPIIKPTLVTFHLESVQGGTLLRFCHSGFEGFINEYIIRFILSNGWKTMFAKKIIRVIK